MSLSFWPFEVRFHTVSPALPPPTARAAAVGEAYSSPSSMRSLPSAVTVTTQRSPLRGRSQTSVSPGMSNPASRICMMVTRFEVGVLASVFLVRNSSLNVDRSVRSAS